MTEPERAADGDDAAGDPTDLDHPVTDDDGPVDVLVPIDGSEPSMRALRYAAQLVGAFGGSLHVVHFTAEETEATRELIERAEAELAAAGIDADPEVDVDLEMDLRPAKHVGERIVELAEAEGYGHVVMGHHGAGTVERAILGSAAETVVRAEAVPVTVVP
ncbi:MAG: universal stress protein [Halobacteriaceae archaeon]